MNEPSVTRANTRNGRSQKAAGVSLQRVLMALAGLVLLILASQPFFSFPIVGFWFLPWRSWWALVPFAVYPVYATLVHAPLSSGARYVVPVWPQLLCLGVVVSAGLFWRDGHWRWWSKAGFTPPKTPPIWTR